MNEINRFRRTKLSVSIEGVVVYDTGSKTCTLENVPCTFNLLDSDILLTEPGINNLLSRMMWIPDPESYTTTPSIDTDSLVFLKQLMLLNLSAEYLHLFLVDLDL